MRHGGRLLALFLLIGASGGRADPLPGALPLPESLGASLDAAREAAGSNGPPRTRHLDATGKPLFVNRLALERSPYLLQHGFNPVNWFPWGDEAFAEARRLERPVLLSVGYSTCHWCHVMEEESFEDPEIAKFMNEHYVAIKVDREERPDIDGVYMAAVQAIAGRGGWPMTVWLTPERKPFFGGTYFPRRDGARGRQVGFLTALRQLHEAYTADHEKVGNAARRLAASLRAALVPKPSVGVSGASEMRAALAGYKRTFDHDNGGVRSQQKFPSVLPIGFLLRGHRRTGDPVLLDMARQTLDAMARGGIYDHVGGGFHRYTVEPSWTVPHFEKMLYDNALLVVDYLEGLQVSGDARYAEVARDVLAYVAREMTAPEGSFYSATDADSDGEEGRFFVWTAEEMREAVGSELGELAISAYGLNKPPNFEKSYWVLRRDASLASLVNGSQRPAEVMAFLREARTRLRDARAKRVPPHTDEKQLVAWNGLMISAFARAGMVLRDPELIERGERAARALLERARPEGRLARYLKNGAPHGTGLLDDFAFFVAGLIDLFEATGDATWLEAALSLQAELDAHFFDDADGGYWISRDDGEALLVREKPGRDGARPSGNSVSVMNLLRLALLTENSDLSQRAEMTLRAFSDQLARPGGNGQMLEALDFMLDTPKEILIVAPNDPGEAAPFLAALGGVFLPNRVIAIATEANVASLAARIPILEGKRALEGRTTAYVCENRVCELPAREPALFEKQLRKAALPYATEVVAPGDAGITP